VARVSVFLITVALIAGMAGCGGGDGDGYTPLPSQNLEIRDWYDLNAVRNNLAGNHTLMNDLDSTTPGYEELASPTANGGKGWDPIGFFYADPLTGSFDGGGYKIKDLFINRPDRRDVGLFGEVDEGCDGRGVIKDIGVVSVTVTGVYYVGGLVGINRGTVSNSYATGNVSGEQSVGGLVGSNWATVSNSYSTGSVTGNDYVGGLVGETMSGSTLSNCYSTGSVTGTWGTGGVVGNNLEGTVIDSYSTGNVTGASWVGGLVGYNYEGIVSNSYSTGTITGGTITGTWGTGGVVGNNLEGTVINSYSTGNVTCDKLVGGLVGFNTGTVSNSYATGNVSGEQSVGGLVGANNGAVSNSFWDVQTSGQTMSAGGTGKTTAEMKSIATFSGAKWKIIAVAMNQTNPSYIWNIVDKQTYPFLSWQS
jgi:hypothetical protein